MYLIYKVGCDFYFGGDGNGGGVFANGNLKNIYETDFLAFYLRHVYLENGSRVV